MTIRRGRWFFFFKKKYKWEKNVILAKRLKNRLLVMKVRYESTDGSPVLPQEINCTGTWT